MKSKSVLKKILKYLFQISITNIRELIHMLYTLFCLCIEKQISGKKKNIQIILQNY